MNKIVIAPSILSLDYSNVSAQLEELKTSKAKWLHFDVMDGHFVPNLTFGPDILKGFKKACPLFMDVHPKTYAPIFIKNGADLVTFHTEALDNDLSRIQGLLDEIHNLGAKGGIVVKPNTAIEPFESVLKSCDLVLVMSVEPGFGGQKFMADMLKKVEWLKEKREELNLSYRMVVLIKIHINLHWMQVVIHWLREATYLKMILLKPLKVCLHKYDLCCFDYPTR